MSDPIVKNDAPSAGRPTDTVLGRVKRGAFAEMAGYAANIVVRLGANLIMTRLLFPEAFGLMAMVQVVLYGLAMLSDVGVSQSVVMSKRGDEPAYLDTAWTVQAIRGVALWVAACVLTYPIAFAFDESQLLWMLPIATASAAIHGLTSTRVFTLRRRLHLGPLVYLEVGALTVQVGFGIVGALLDYGVASLVAAHLVGNVVSTAASHYLPCTNHRNRFRLEPTARHEMFVFGRWIFLSSALTFLAIRSDQLVLGRWLGATLLGIYNIAHALAEMFDTLANRLASGVLYPTLARVHAENPAEFANVYYATRAWFDRLLFVGIGGIAAMSEWIIDLMYDDRYSGAAEMLRILAFRTAAAILATMCEVCFVAQGSSVYSFRFNAFVAPAMLVAMPIGGLYWGTSGVLWGAVIARCFGLLALWPEAHRRGFLRPSRELLALAYLAVGYGLGIVAVEILPDV